ncbi:phage major capsid protein [Tabrizicola sp. KVB23]|uniref:Phage major capsid protein n=1 Tax=Fuscibacter oryzae TaxID=2803939 RepID=A0A8J7MRT8_9RHOB|nr:phage major capsid protein [Fuscibacter oryzae]
MTRAVTVEQINANRGQGRLARFGEVRSFSAEERTVELAFSSEAPVDRWFGTEILDHAPTSIRLDRLNNAAALLLDHDWTRQIGVVESVEIGADRIGRATVRFSRSPEAEAVFQDVLDKIRQHVSVGYFVHGFVQEMEDDNEIVRITDWEPFEISLVAVPADPSVGVGRSQQAPEEPPPQGGQGADTRASPANPQHRSSGMKTIITRDAQGNLVRAKVDESGVIVEIVEILERAGEAEVALTRVAETAARTRVTSLMELGRTYGATDLAEAAVADGSTPEQLQTRILERMTQRGQRQRPVGENTQAQRDQEVGLTDEEVHRFSFFRGLRAQLPGATAADREAAAFELECSAAAAQRYGRDARGLMIPHEVLSRAFNAGGAANTPVGATSGANLVGRELLAGSFIDMLRNRTAFLRLAQSMAGLVGNVDVPKQIAGASAYWIAENADATEGVATIGQVSMSPKTIAAYSDITRRLLMQSTPDAERLIRNDLNAALALGIDLAGFYGSGAANNPRGLKNVSGINLVDFATVAQPTYAEIVDMEAQIAADNADVDSMAYVLNALMRGKLKTTQKFTGTDGAPVWEPGNTVNGYRTEVTNQITTGDVFFGNFADCIVGMWGGLDVTIDPYSLSKSGGLRIVMFQDVDFVFRHPESFCYGVMVP